MKKISIKHFLFTAVIFILSILIVIGEGAYKKAVSGESATFYIAISEDKLKPLVFDIAKEGLPKKLVQPGLISISTGHGAGVVNKTNKTIYLQVRAEGFSDGVIVNSTDTSFEKQTGKFTKPVDPNGALNLSFVFSIPYKNTAKGLVSSGNVEFIDSKSGNLLAELPIKIINSRSS